MVSTIERFHCTYVQNAVQWLCSMYSQSDSSSLPGGVCGPPRRGTGGKINKGGSGVCLWVGVAGLLGKNEGMFPCKGAQLDTC